ncbi:MAG: hypothetical protein OXC40_02605, partial [Proteobacteria bacterium]|nr:hypothetical protein [Pseudomonadota bacterium]
MGLFNKVKNILPSSPHLHSTSLKFWQYFSTTEFMIHAGVILGLTLFSGCQDSAVEEEDDTTAVYQERKSRMGSSAINDGSHGIDLVLVVDNSNSMVKYGTTNSSTHSKGYFSPQTSAHKLDKAFDVFAQQ